MLFGGILYDFILCEFQKSVHILQISTGPFLEAKDENPFFSYVQ